MKSPFIAFEKSGIRFGPKNPGIRFGPKSLAIRFGSLNGFAAYGLLVRNFGHSVRRVGPPPSGPRLRHADVANPPPLASNWSLAIGVWLRNVRHRLIDAFMGRSLAQCQAQVNRCVHGAFASADPKFGLKALSFGRVAPAFGLIRRLRYAVVALPYLFAE